MTRFSRVRAAHALSPRLVRCLLVSACAAGLAGVAHPSDPLSPQTPPVAAVSVARVAALQPPVVLAPRVIVPRATRTRALPARPARVTPRTSLPRAATWVRPCAAGVNSLYGMRWGQPHKGIDFAASYGDPLHAIGDGVVVGAGYQSEEGGYGQITLIRHADGIVSAYAHQSRMVVQVGDHVRAGQLIGYVGATGHVTGPHLHFEIRTETHGGQVDPQAWFAAHDINV